MRSILALLALAGLALAAPIDDLDAHLKEHFDVDKLHAVIHELDKEAHDEAHEDEAELAELQAAFMTSHKGQVVTHNTSDIFSINNANGIEGDLFEGDLLLTEDQMEAAMSEHPENPRMRRQAITERTRLWNGGAGGQADIPYTFDNYPSGSRGALQAAMQFWNERTCINFRQANGGDKNMVKFIYGNGCYSYVGKTGWPTQDVSIGRGCESLPIVAHELSHTIGTLHVQSRTDRETYVSLNEANIEKEQMHNFKIEPATNNFGIPYEFGSVMHYHQFSFNKQQGVPTLYARNRDYQDSMSAPEPTFYDIKLINSLYNCDSLCRGQTVSCQNGGYQNPRRCGTCHCPNGFTGNTCSQVVGERRVSSTPTSLQVKGGNRGAARVQQSNLPKQTMTFTASPGRKVELTVSNFGMYTYPGYGCADMGLEIQTSDDTRMAGFRWCMSGTKTYRSTGSKITVTSYTNEGEVYANLSAREV